MTLSLPTRYIFSLTLAPSCPIHPFRPPPPLGRSPRDPPSIQIHQPRSAPIHPSHPASDHRPQFQRHPTNHRTSAMPCFLSPPCLARCPICIAPLPAFPAAASLHRSSLRRRASPAPGPCSTTLLPFPSCFCFLSHPALSLSLLSSQHHHGWPPVAPACCAGVVPGRSAPKSLRLIQPLHPSTPSSSASPASPLPRRSITVASHRPCLCFERQDSTSPYASSSTPPGAVLALVLCFRTAPPPRPLAPSASHAGPSPSPGALKRRRR